LRDGEAVSMDASTEGLLAFIRKPNT